MNMQLTARLTVVLLLISLTIVAPALGDTIPEKWKSVDVKELTNEASKLQGKPPGVEGNIELMAGYAAERYAAARAAGKLKIAEWMPLVSILGNRLPAKTRESMVREIEKKFAPDRQAVSKLGYDVCKRTALILTRLESDKGRAILATWGETTGALNSAKPQELARFAGDMAWTGSLGKKARIRLADHVAKKYLVDAKTIRLVHGHVWRDLARHLAADFSAGRRGQWISKLLGTFLAAEMKVGDLGGLVAALRDLGDKDTVGFVGAWMDKHETWKTWKPAELSWLASFLGGKSEAARSGRRKLASHVEAKYLVVDTKMIQSINSHVWRNLAYRLAAELGAKRRSQWINKLRSAFLAAEMKVRDLRSLPEALRFLGDKDAVGFVSAWMDKHETWKSWKPADLVELASVLKGKSEAITSARRKLTPHVEAKYLGDAKAARSVSSMEWRDFVKRLNKELSARQRTRWADTLGRAFLTKPMECKNLWVMVEAVQLLGDKSVAQKYTKRIYKCFLGSEKARSTVKLETLGQIGRALYDSGLAGRGKGHPELAAAVVELAKGDKAAAPWRETRSLGRALGTQGNRQVLIAALGDDRGRPRQELVNVLLWAYRSVGESWEGLVDKILSKPGLDADGRARWIAAIARAEGPVRGSGAPNMKRLARALGAAESPDLQIALLGELVRVHTGTRRYGVALQVIDDAAVRLKRTSASAKSASLQKEVAQAQSTYLAKRRAGRAAVRKRTAEARLRELKRRLAGSRKRKDKKKIARLERLIKQHEAARGKDGRPPGGESKPGAGSVTK